MPVLPTGALPYTLLGGIYMFTGMSDADISVQYVELLPARTVLSVQHTGIGDVLGGNNNGADGNQGGAGKAPGLKLFDWLTHPGTAQPGTAAAGAGTAGAGSAD
ncbi:MAG TPA: hypothetical protein VE673_00365 [Pseudonocardiaceae bacterium]|nr:hypothetical protein [Pseudonocardiaceae bacterium]